MAHPISRLSWKLLTHAVSWVIVLGGLVLLFPGVAYLGIFIRRLMKLPPEDSVNEFVFGWTASLIALICLFALVMIVYGLSRVARYLNQEIFGSH